MSESIFRSIARSFCKGFFALMGILVGLLVLGGVISRFMDHTQKVDKLNITIAPDAEGNRERLTSTAPVILRMDIHGVIGTRQLTSKSIESQLFASNENDLKGRVKGILLHINSPGGVAVDSDSIYTALIEYKEKHKLPIYAFIDGMCASGGMYISSAADKIYSKPMGIIGSIGVILGPFFNVAALMEKIGVDAKTFTQGKDKDMLNPFRVWKPGEDDSINSIIQYDYARFTDIFTKARPKVDKTKLINVYGAQVYAPPEAQKIGYIDEADSSYSQVLNDLTKEAGIKEAYQVVQLQMPHLFFSDIMEQERPFWLSGKMTHSLDLGPEWNPELFNKVLYLYQPSNALK